MFQVTREPTTSLYLGCWLPVLLLLAGAVPLLRGPARLAGDVLAALALSALALPAGPLLLFPLLLVSQAAFPLRLAVVTAAGLTAVSLALAATAAFSHHHSVLYTKVNLTFIS